jgi:hypothetical protein
VAARPRDRALVHDAQRLAEDLLADVGSRFQHTRGVGARATTALPAVAEPDRPFLLAAAWLHDIGYAKALQRTGFHPVDGAHYLQEHGWPRVVVGLVAHHSGARFVAAVRGLAALLDPFSEARYVHGPLADALTFADQTTATNGAPIDVEDRMADMLRRHGPDSPNARCHHVRAPALRAAVQTTQLRIREGRRAHGEDATPVRAAEASGR